MDWGKKNQTKVEIENRTHSLTLAFGKIPTVAKSICSANSQYCLLSPKADLNQVRSILTSEFVKNGLGWKESTVEIENNLDGSIEQKQKTRRMKLWEWEVVISNGRLRSLTWRASYALTHARGIQRVFC